MKHTFKNNPSTIALAVLTLTGALSGCGTAVREQVRVVEDKVTKKVADEQEMVAKPVPVVSRSRSSFLMGQAVQIAKAASPILDKRLAYSPRQRVTLSDVATYVSQQTGLSVDTSEVWTFINSASAGQGQVQTNSVLMPPPVVPSLSGMPATAAKTNANGSTLLSVDYEGTLSGLLDDVANKSGVWWKFSEGRITFFRSETDTFYIPATARISTGKSSITANTSSGSSSGSTTSGATSSSNGGASNTNDYEVDIWKDLAKTASTVAGGATVDTNKSAGSITVTGTPTQVRNVREWVKALTDNLSQQVAITVHIYKVNLNSEDNYGWNPSVVFNSLSSKFGITLTGAQPPSIASGATPMSLSASVLTTATGDAAQYAGSKFAYQALSTMGNVYDQMEQTIITLNGRPAPFQDATVQTYLASSQTTTTTSSATSTLTPGTLTTGFTAVFLPKIVNGRVLLDIDMTTSTNGGITTFTSSDSTIQTPKYGLNSSTQSVSLTPGQSLLLTGTNSESGTSNQSGTGTASNYAFGGGHGDVSKRVMTAILITAKVL